VDNEIYCLGLRRMLENPGEVSVVRETGTVVDAIVAAGQLKPDVVLLELRLPDGYGVEACREIRSASPGTRIIFLTAYTEKDAVTSSVIGGADAYLLKTIGKTALMRAIINVAKGRSILDLTVTRPIITRMRSLSLPSLASTSQGITSRERRILALMLEGKTNEEIAASLQLNRKTLTNFLHAAFRTFTGDPTL
jgi:two-component system response regulator DevR